MMKNLKVFFEFAAARRINIPLSNQELNQRISEFIKHANPNSKDDMYTLSNIIYTVLYISDTETLLKQDKGIVKELKSKFKNIREKIAEENTQYSPYLFYNTIRIDKFIDYYESKKSKKQSSEYVESTQLSSSDEYFIEELQNRLEYCENSPNTKKAIEKCIEYYKSKQDRKSQKSRIQRKSGKNSKNYSTLSGFEQNIKDVVSEIFNTKIEYQYQIADRETDFCIIFEHDCEITIGEGFKIPIKKGTKIAIEADGATHFENTVQPENLKEAQDAISGKTIERDHEIKGALIDSKGLCTSLKKED